jgi:hypothetical protein
VEFNDCLHEPREEEELVGKVLAHLDIFLGHCLQSGLVWSRNGLEEERL